MTETIHVVPPTLASVLHTCATRALHAPSTHNTQPWQFKLTDDGIELYADRKRTLPVVDPEGRELLLSCGALLFFLRVALEHHGQHFGIHRFPEDTDPDFLARIRVVGTGPGSPENDLLYDAIEDRRTDRGAFTAEMPTTEQLEDLIQAAHSEGAGLTILYEDEERHRLADLIAEADRAQQGDPLFRAELSEWLNPHPDRRLDGIPVHVPFMSGALPWIVRTFDRGDGQAASDRELALGSPILAILSTAEDRPSDHLLAGEALGRVLLTAADATLNASFMSQPLEVPELRPMINDLAGPGRFAQMILRLGHSRALPAPTPRRPLESCLRT